jgi:hypothetical protein
MAFHNQSQQHPSKKVALSPNQTRPPVPPWSADMSTPSGGGFGIKASPTTPSMSKQTSASSQWSGTPTLPINLSLSEDERSPKNRAGSELQSPQQFSKSMSSSSSQLPDGSLEPADMLYEYFPLSLDDW